MLGIGREPERHNADIAMQQIAPLNNRIVPELGRTYPSALHIHTRLEPGAEPEIIHLLTPPPDHVARARHAGGDDVVGEHPLRELPDEFL